MPKRRSGFHSAVSRVACPVLLLSTALTAWPEPSQAAMAPGSALPGLSDGIDLSPFWDWKTIETGHFRVTFPKELEPVAQKAANYLEEAHGILKTDLQWEPEFKTQVLLVDNADTANGMAAPVGRIGIILYANPPDNHSSIAYYDDWLRLLCIHEYAHILNIDPTHGFYKTLRVLFGDVLLPNSLWPGWMIEGLAVYLETRMTQSGRGRSPYYEMILRSAVEEGALDRGDYVTLDRINGTNPFHPGGETAYLFGYQLMNQVARDLKAGGEYNLGAMSKRSGGRIPFFINGNLENLTGKTWSRYWKEWVSETNARMKADLAKIKNQPLTPALPLVSGDYGALAPALSRDGKWLVYTLDSLHRRRGLYLRDLKTGATRRLAHRIGGVGSSFTPDSKSVIYSTLNRRNQFYLFSDIRAFDLETGKDYPLSDALRAKDPDVSPDGTRIVFTLTEKATTGIAIARLSRGKNGKVEMFGTKMIHSPALLDRASNPRFSPDGKRVVFTINRNGHVGEELIELEIDSGITQTLVSDGSYNRFPAFDEKGRLHYVSNRSGVDNIWRYVGGEKNEQVTNVTTGVWFPAFGNGKTYASHFSIDGWDIAALDLSKKTVSTTQVAVAPSTAPKTLLVTYKAPDGSARASEKVLASEIAEGGIPEVAHPAPDKTIGVRNSVTLDAPKTYATEDYSIFPSILPRQWLPLLQTRGGEIYFGGQILGFDATDRHRYVLGYAYDSFSGKGDYLGVYTTRALGPTLTFSGEKKTLASARLTTSDAIEQQTFRTEEYGLEISFPFRGTFSALVPSLSLKTQRDSTFVRINEDETSAITRFTPSLEAGLSYGNVESSRLALGTERGRRSAIATESFFGADENPWKFFASHAEYFPITRHSVLSPKVAASYTTRTSDLFSTYSAVRGRAFSPINSLPNSSPDRLVIRGYPNQLFLAKSALVHSWDYRFPIARIFRGLGTNPFYFENLWGVTFVEGAWLPSGSAVTALTSAGAGLRLDAEFFLRLPLVFSMDYHHGLKRSAGGGGELFFGINLGALPF